MAKLATKKPLSPAITLLDHVWGSVNKATDHSWERLNHAMRDALLLAIGGGFMFEIDDVEWIFGNYNSSYWIGESDEWIYCEAVAAGNMPAIKSYEKCKGREPFIAERVDLPHVQNDYLHGSSPRRQKERLTVGASFKWQGVEIKVTSFARDQSHAVACSYKPRRKGEYGDKIDKRFRITRAELLEGRAQDRERKRLLDRFRAISDEATRLKIVRPLHIKGWDGFATVPLDKLRKALDKHAPLPPSPPRAKRLQPIVITHEHIAAAIAAGAPEWTEEIFSWARDDQDFYAAFVAEVGSKGRSRSKSAKSADKE